MTSPCTCFRCCVEGQSIIFCCTNAGHFMCYIPNHNKWYNLRPPLTYKPDPKVGVKSMFGTSLKYHKICSNEKNLYRKIPYMCRAKLSALKCVSHTCKRFQSVQIENRCKCFLVVRIEFFLLIVCTTPE